MRYSLYSLYYLAQINIGALQASVSNLYKIMHNNYVKVFHRRQYFVHPSPYRAIAPCIWPLHVYELSCSSITLCPQLGRLCTQSTLLHASLQGRKWHECVTKLNMLQMCACIQALYEYFITNLCGPWILCSPGVNKTLYTTEPGNVDACTDQFQMLQDGRVWAATQEKQAPSSTTTKTHPCPQNQVSACQPVYVTHIKWLQGA